MKSHHTSYQTDLHNQIFPLSERELQMHFAAKIQIGHVSVEERQKTC